MQIAHIKIHQESSKQYAHSNNRNCCDVIIPVAIVVNSCIFASLVPAHSSKLRWTYLKTEVC
jgi:hypothetical protein